MNTTEKPIHPVDEPAAALAGAVLVRAVLVRAVAAWGEAIGEEHVIVDAAKRDEVATATFATTAGVVAIVRPGSVEDVQACLAVAQEHGVAVHPISTGHNWSYGSAVPYADGCALLDLGRMNRIVEFSEKFAYVVIEPGVTQLQLGEYLAQRRSKLMVSVTSSGSDTSIVGNTLERGVAGGPTGDRFRNVGGFEVVLADGTLLRTGLDRIEGAKAGGMARWAPGPAVDGLFSQSNLGVVTKMSVYLAPKPEYFQVFVATINSDEGLVALTDTLQQMRMSGVLRTSFAIWNHYKFIATMRQYPWEETGGKTPLSKKLAQKLIKKAGMGAWNVVGALYSNSEEQAKADRALVDRGLKRWLTVSSSWIVSG